MKGSLLSALLLPQCGAFIPLNLSPSAQWASRSLNKPVIQVSTLSVLEQACQLMRSRSLSTRSQHTTQEDLEMTSTPAPDVAQAFENVTPAHIFAQEDTHTGSAAANEGQVVDAPVVNLAPRAPVKTREPLPVHDAVKAEMQARALMKTRLDMKAKVAVDTALPSVVLAVGPVPLAKTREPLPPRNVQKEEMVARGLLEVRMSLKPVRKEVVNVGPVPLPKTKMQVPTTDTVQAERNMRRLLEARLQSVAVERTRRAMEMNRRAAEWRQRSLLAYRLEQDAQIRAARLQLQEEAKRSERYCTKTDVHEAAFAILVDLGMVDTLSSNQEGADDHEYADGMVYLR